MVDLDEKLAVDELRVDREFRRVLHDVRRDASRLQLSHQLVAVASPGPRRDDLVKFVVARMPLAGAQRRQVVAPHRCRQRRPLAVVDTGDRDPVVVEVVPRGAARCGLVRTLGCEHQIPVAPRLPDAPIGRALEQCRPHQVQSRLSLGHVDVLAAAGLALVLKRRHHRGHQPARRRVVGVRGERARWRPIGPPDRIEEAGDRCGHGSEAGKQRKRTGLAHQAARRHHHVGAALTHLFPAHAPTGHRLGRERLQDHVCPVDEVPDDLHRFGL